MSYRAFLAASIVVALAGCGGGGGGTAGVPTGGGVVPQPVATTAPTTSPSSGLQTAQLVLRFPLGAAKSSGVVGPHYVSPNTTKLQVLVNTVNGSAPPSWVPANTTTTLVFTAGGNCTVSGGTATCTIPVAAPPGSVNYTFNAQDASSHVLATLTATESITQGITNNLSVTLQGVVSTVTLSAAALAANDASHATTGEAVTMSAFDASGAQIVNGTTSANFSNPITLTDNDATAQTKLSVNGGAAAASVTVNNPSDAVTLVYTGQATNGFTITASGTGITGSGSISTTVNNVTFTGTTLDDAAHGGVATDPNYNQPTVFFSQASGSQSVTGAETGWTNAPFSQQFDLDPGNGTSSTCGTGGAIASFSANPATSFTITAAGAGVCSVRLKEHGTGYPITGHAAGGDGTVWVSVTTSSFGVN